RVRGRRRGGGREGGGAARGLRPPRLPARVRGSLHRRPHGPRVRGALRAAAGARGREGRAGAAPLGAGPQRRGVGAVMDDTTRIQDEYYTLVTSALADERTRVLKHGGTFGVFDHYGDMCRFGPGEQGIY